MVLAPRWLLVWVWVFGLYSITCTITMLRCGCCAVNWQLLLFFSLHLHFHLHLHLALSYHLALAMLHATGASLCIVGAVAMRNFERKIQQAGALGHCTGAHCDTARACAW